MVSDIHKVIEIGKKYLEIRIELLKLDFKEQASHYLLKTGFLFVSVLIFFVILLFLSLGLAFYLNELTNSSYYGFFIMAGIFFLMAILLLLLRNNKSVHKKFHDILDFFIFDKNE